MADPVDRVFVHALNTVKKIPKTGASRPPPPDRLRLYGLYKQAMEGDVDGVMERPVGGAGMAAEELSRERDKWDAWNSQRGLTRIEAKRRYIEALIVTMHRYATTPEAKELVDELEFVWNQIKNNSPGSSDASPKAAATHGNVTRRFEQPLSGAEGPLKILSPMSEQDELEQETDRKSGFKDDEDAGGPGSTSTPWMRKVERSLAKLSAEVAALREQIMAGREWRSKREKSLASWIGWLASIAAKHLAIDFIVLAVVLLWMRRRKDKRLEDLVRAALKIGREYVRSILPSR